MKRIFLAILAVTVSIGSFCQEFELDTDQTIIRDDITRSDIEKVKPGMTMREVLSVLGYPEASAVQLPFMSYKASDRNDGYRYILYLSMKEPDEEIMDLKIVAAVAAKSPWTYSEPYEIIWETEEWRIGPKEESANQAVDTTRAKRPSCGCSKDISCSTLLPRLT